MLTLPTTCSSLSPTLPHPNTIFVQTHLREAAEAIMVAWVVFLPFRPFHLLKTCCSTNLFCAENCLCLAKSTRKVLPSEVALEPANAEKSLSESFPGQRRDGWDKARSSLMPEGPKVLQAYTFASVFTFCLTELELNLQPLNAFPGL